MLHQSLNNQVIKLFQQTVWQFYTLNKRAFLWRNTTEPYHIVISEIMLQQTQTLRVGQKFDQFVTTFPDFEKLAQATLAEVLLAWQGLGYNRRARALHKIAQKVVSEFDGSLPKDPEVLETFPGIGPNTAGSICAFAFNMPTIFVETNIRAVFIHTFFTDKDNVHDKEILPLVEQTVDKDNPREWYYALMDYGVMVKKLHRNPARKSKHYAVQSKFEGSDRQIRSMILKKLLKQNLMSLDQFFSVIQREPARIEKIIEQMCKEGFLKKVFHLYKIV